MNNTARKIIMMQRQRRMQGNGNDYRGYDRMNDSRDMRGYDNRDRNDYASYSKNAYNRGYNTGRDHDDGNDYGNRDYNQDMRGSYDRNDGYNQHDKMDGHYNRTPFMLSGEMGYGDYAEQEPLKLTKHEMEEWKRSMRNADGTMGEHFEMGELIQAAKNVGINFRDYSEKEFCLVVNMLYSDYCQALKGAFPPDREMLHYVKMARAWLEDDDGPEPREKLALYYNCIIKDD